MKAKVTVNSVGVVTTKFVFGMSNCMVASDVATDAVGLCWGFCNCVDNHMCDCTCLCAWTATCPKYEKNWITIMPRVHESSLQI